MPIEYPISDSLREALEKAYATGNPPTPRETSWEVSRLASLGLLKLNPKSGEVIKPAGADDILDRGSAIWFPSQKHLDGLRALRQHMREFGSIKNMKGAAHFASKAVVKQLADMGLLVHSSNGYIWDTGIGAYIDMHPDRLINCNTDYQSLPATAVNEHSDECRRHGEEYVANQRAINAERTAAILESNSPESILIRLNEDDIKAFLSFKSMGARGKREEEGDLKIAVSRLITVGALLRFGPLLVANPRIDLAALPEIKAWPTNMDWAVLKGLASLPPNVQIRRDRKPSSDLLSGIRSEAYQRAITIWLMAGRIELQDDGTITRPVYQASRLTVAIKDLIL